MRVLILVMLAASSAWAKPKLAVLGLQVDGKADTASVKLARDVTTALRARVGMGTGPYQLAPDSSRSLIDLKVAAKCSDESLNCMARIGSDMLADQMIWGHLEKRGDGYLVTLRLVDVNKKTLSRTRADILDAGRTGQPEVMTFGKRMYGLLTGMVSASLVVKTNANATLIVDGQPKGSIVGGQARLEGLTPGRHRVRLDAQGFLRYEMIVVLPDDGEDMDVTIEMERPSKR